MRVTNINTIETEADGPTLPSEGQTSFIVTPEQREAISVLLSKYGDNKPSEESIHDYYPQAGVSFEEFLDCLEYSLQNVKLPNKFFAYLEKTIKQLSRSSRQKNDLPDMLTRVLANYLEQEKKLKGTLEN